MPYINGVFVTVKEASETTQTVGNAVSTAIAILKQRNYNEFCCNAVRGRSYDEKITMVEHGNLVDAIVADTYFYSS